VNSDCDAVLSFVKYFEHRFNRKLSCHLLFVFVEGELFFFVLYGFQFLMYVLWWMGNATCPAAPTVPSTDSSSWGLPLLDHFITRPRSGPVLRSFKQDKHIKSRDLCRIYILLLVFYLELLVYAAKKGRSWHNHEIAGDRGAVLCKKTQRPDGPVPVQKVKDRTRSVPRSSYYSQN
jgi:hypothetical protein